MNSQKIVGLVILAILVIGGLWWSLQQPNRVSDQQDQQDQQAEMRNSEMLAEQGKYTALGSEVTYFETTKGFLAKPEQAGSYPGVVLIHENRGTNDYFRGMAKQLASQGYMVLAVDLFGKSVETQEEARALTSALDQTKATQNLRAAAQYLRNQGATKIASLGWCFGGGQSLTLALSGEPMDATVIYYGRLVTDEAQLAKIKWPVLGIFGDQDQSISVASVNQFDAALDKLGVTNEIYIYPGVGHAFANPSGMNYAANETKDAWAKTVTFLNKHLTQTN
jgi:carboxymethylenebutenolidase